MGAEREAMTLERQAFEIFANERGYSLRTIPGGCYGSLLVDSMWNGWQAAITHLSRAAEPVYQAKFPGDEGWCDVSAVDYETMDHCERRILYTHPPEPARDANRWRQVWIDERAYRYRRAGGMNTEWARLNAEADANRIDAAMAQESGE